MKFTSLESHTLSAVKEGIVYISDKHQIQKLNKNPIACISAPNNLAEFRISALVTFYKPRKRRKI
jgi:hypothetical protein